MKISLMVLSAGKAAGKALPISGTQFIIGRDPQCNLRPASAMISKRHCAVLVKSGQAFLRDFESTNGTFVNDEQIKGEVPLKDGDILRLGPLSFKLVIEGMPAPTKPTPKPKGADMSDEDAAAAMLSMDEETGEVTVSSTETSDDHQIPGGSTVMDMPAFVPADAPPEAPKEEAAKKEGKSSEDKKKANAATGAAQDAAKNLLEKMRQGRRK
jgi:pSer/pThr/pTyr-binding forkhead associated (FHA) protein